MTLSASPRPRRPRTGAVALATLVLGGTTFLCASAAVAAPGDSGVLKVHPAGVPAANTSDAPKVCTFNLAASNFQTLPAVSYSLTPLPKAATKPTLTGRLKLKKGAGATQNLSLPNGTYTLTWTFPGGVPKHKNFKVDCGAADHKPLGPVHAGGGGVPPTTTGGTGGGSSIAAPLLVTGAIATAGLIFVRRTRRRAHGVA
ncbi:hypothetical protein [Streptomyces sp. NRRL F-5126]|uniref:hypothetical protein n=1 Tax=Streptomyces sp. NRRL F-5126 TaxID=1463857 RepID=UPI0004C78733|nr:hypothetical protein [Streptomyces sp. NRRL F-5126]